MRIGVCVKQVPDTSVRLEVDEGGLLPRSSGYLPVLNPYDEFALEEALRLREEAGAGEVVVLTLAAEPVDESVFHALAMGADRALVLELPRAEASTPLRASVLLARELSRLRADLVFCGERAVDDEAAAVGPGIAEALGWPQLCGVESAALREKGTRLEALCRRGGSRCALRAPVPCVATFLRGQRLPRYPSMDGIFSARGKPVERRAADPRVPGAAGRSALRVPAEERSREMISGPTGKAVERLLERAAERVDVL